MIQKNRKFIAVVFSFFLVFALFEYRMDRKNE